MQTGLRQLKSVGSLVKLSADHALKFSLAGVWGLEELLEPRCLQQGRQCCRPEESRLPVLRMRAREREQHLPAPYSS